MSTSIAFVDRAGFKILELRPGYIKSTLPLAGNENHIGTVYAGALFTLAEVPVGVLAVMHFSPEKYYPILKSFNIDYKRAAKTDVWIEHRLEPEVIADIEAKIAEFGKAEFQVTAEIKDANNEVVAIATGTYQIRARTK